jgi:hypothetical protein
VTLTKPKTFEEMVAALKQLTERIKATIREHEESKQAKKNKESNE